MLGTDVIHKILLQYDRVDSLLAGIKFIGSDGETLVVAGSLRQQKMDSEENDDEYAIKEIVLESGQRLLGVVSGRRGNRYAEHYDLQFVIGSQP